LLIAVSDKDEINLLCCMTPHSINPNLHSIAGVRIRSIPTRPILCVI
jgi:trk system potassium uptake protein TrkA